MDATDPRSEPLVQAVSSALERYQWRRFRPELLARAFLAAADRERLQALLSAVPGAAVGTWDALEPATRDDPRLTGLVEFLSTTRWTELNLSALCRQLLAVLRAGREH